MSFVETMDAEIADLERKLAAVRAARAAYVQVDSSAPYSPNGLVLDRVSNARGYLSATLRSPRRSEKSARLIKAAREYIELMGGPIPTSELQQVIEKQGIAISGSNPRNALSAMLSNSGLFKANGREGWTLKEATPPRNTEAADALFPSQEAPAASVEPRLTSEGTPQRGQAEPAWPGGGT